MEQSPKSGSISSIKKLAPQKTEQYNTGSLTIPNHLVESNGIRHSVLKRDRLLNGRSRKNFAQHSDVPPTFELRPENTEKSEKNDGIGSITTP